MIICKYRSTYEWVGVYPLFLFNGVTFLLTQGLERYLDADHSHILPTDKDAVQSRAKIFWADLKEGIRYLKQEPGLLAITSYFFVTMMASASSQTLLLPYFTGLNMVSRYSILMSIATLGRVIGGLLHYKFKYPAPHKFKIALFVYISISILEGTLLYQAYPVMAVCYLFVGVLGVTSFNIRISGTQSYLAPDKRGRFNGIFMMITMLGTMLGQFASGMLGDYFPIPYVISGFMAVNIVGALVIMLKNRQAVKVIYNQNI